MNRKLYASLALSVGLSACGAAGKLTYAAADINPTLISIQRQDEAEAKKNKFQYLFLVVKDSRTKCSEFQAELTRSDLRFNTSADILSTVASVGGTLFPAAATVHAISAAGSLINGTKTAVDSDIWAKQTISDLQAAIGNLYTVNMNKYVTNLVALNEADIILSAQIDQILNIHSACNLASAQTALHAVAAAPATPTGQDGAPAKPNSLKPDALLLAPLPQSHTPAPVLINPYAAWR